MAMTSGLVLSITLGGLPANVSVARRHVSESLSRRLGDHPAVHAAAFVVGELAANAAQHTRSGSPNGTFEVLITTVDDGYRISVRDDGTVATDPAPQPIDLDAEGGRGLYSVAGFTRAWGAYGNAGGRTVWAEVDYTSDAPSSRCSSP